MQAGGNLNVLDFSCLAGGDWGTVSNTGMASIVDAVGAEVGKFITHLMGGKDPAEYPYVAVSPDFWEELAIEKALDGIGNTYVFMGATDYEREGDWHWVTAEGFNYQNWASTQPDNAGGTEHFGQIYFIDNQIKGWNDLPNTGDFQYKLAYIIEFDYLWS
jgi:hypothetical protein